MIVKNCPAYLKQYNGACNERWNAQDLKVPFCADCSDCVIKKINDKLQEIHDTAGTGATTYQERLVREIRELLDLEVIKNQRGTKNG